MSLYAKTFYGHDETGVKRDVRVTAPSKLRESYGKKHREVKYVIIIAILDYLMAFMTCEHEGER